METLYPLVVWVELDATAEYFPPPAGRRTRSFTLLPALPEAIRQATIVPFIGAAYDVSAADPDHWMNVQPWLPQVGWFWRVSVFAASPVGPSTIVPGGCAAARSSCAAGSDGTVRSKTPLKARIPTNDMTTRRKKMAPPLAP